MNHNVKKYIDRWESLIEEADKKLTTNTANDVVWASGWVANVDNVVNSVFDGDSRQINKIFSMKNLAISSLGVVNVGVIAQLNGYLKGTLDDLKGGYIRSVLEQAVLSVMDDLKGQADELLANGLKDAAAIYGRIMLEDAIRRIATDNGITKIGTKGKPLAKTLINVVNQELYNKGIFTQVEMNQNTTWLTVGNKAAHGKFSEYTKKQVEDMLNGINTFINDNIS